MSKGASRARRGRDEELLGERLTCRFTPLVGPGIWRDESDAHGSQRVVDARPVAFAFLRTRPPINAEIS